MTGSERNMRRQRDKSRRRIRARKLAFEQLEIRRVLTADVLQLSLAQSSVSENAGDGAVQATITRTQQFGDYSAPLDVAFQYSQISELVGPDTVTIPAGQQTLVVSLDAVDDNRLDGDQFVQVSIAADNFENANASLIVEDHETLTFQVASEVREDAQTLEVKITRSDIDDLDVQTVVIDSDNSALSAPPLVLPAGAATTTFNLNVHDDNILNGSRAVNLTASVDGFVTGESQVTVTDHETLNVSLNGSSMSEAGGVLTAIVSRSVGAVDTPLDLTLSLNDTSEAAVPATVAIPAGASQVSFQINAVDDALLDGEQAVALAVAAAGYEGDGAGFSVLDSEPLTLELSASSVLENAGGATLLGTVSRPQGQDRSPLLVALRSSDPSRLGVPNLITIPAGMDSALFFAEPRDDNLLTGPVDVQIDAFALHYLPAEASVTIEDHESLSVSIQQDHLLESSSGLMTVTRSNSNNELPLTVQLTATPASEIDLPATVTIPAGASSVDVTLNPIDDGQVEDPVTVEIKAEAPAYVPGQDSVDVVDVERLALKLSKAAVAEDAGAAAIELTITRYDQDISSSLIVSLQSSDTSEIQATAQVTIAAGQRSATTTLDVIDDTLLDGTQTVDVTASAGGYDDSAKSITVDDVESLTLVVDRNKINEIDGVGAATATLTRSNTDTGSALRVDISNSDPSELTTVSFVEIPAGAQQVTFSIDSLDDGVADGDQIVELTASAGGYDEDADQLTVIDFSGVASWTNPDNPLDVDDSSTVNVRDALLLVYELRTRGAQALPRPTPGFRPPPWLDTNGDGNFNTLDVFLVIEHLNNRTGSNGEGDGEGEGAPGARYQSAPPAPTTTAFVIADAPPQTTLDVSLQTSQPRGQVAWNAASPTPLNEVPLAPSETNDRDVAIADTSSEEADELSPLIDEIADDVDDAFRRF